MSSLLQEEHACTHILLIPLSNLISFLIKQDQVMLGGSMMTSSISKCTDQSFRNAHRDRVCVCVCVHRGEVSMCVVSVCIYNVFLKKLMLGGLNLENIIST